MSSPLPPRARTTIVGLGPAGTGPLIAAARADRLDALLSGGLALIDARDRIGAGDLGAYVLRSDSGARSFAEGVADGGLGPALDTPTIRDRARELTALGHEPAPLERAAALLDAVGASFARAWRDDERVQLRLSTRAVGLRRRGESWELELEDAAGRRTHHRSQNVLLALGGEQDHRAALEAALPHGRAIGAARASRTVATDHLMRADGLARVLGGLPERPRIVVLGGSHGAFSSAWLLLERLDERLDPDGVQIFHRGPIRVTFPSAEAARESGYRFDPEDVCPRTGRVHRLGGLRGDGAELWRSLRDGREPRVALRSLEGLTAGELDALLDEADLIVPAFGYRMRLLPVHDERGERVRLAAESGPRVVDQQGRLLDANGRPLPGLFAMGLSSGMTGDAELGGEPSFAGHTNGIWLWQHAIGERVLDGLLQGAGEEVGTCS